MKDEPIVKEWLKYSKNDADAAMQLYKNMYPAPLEIICYHCQQSAEKRLKAVLIAKGIVFDKKHDLAYLIGLMDSGNNISNDLYTCCDSLSQHSVNTRYPGGIQITESDVKKAFKDLKKISSWVRAELKQIRQQDKAQKIASNNVNAQIKSNNVKSMSDISDEDTMGK